VIVEETTVRAARAVYFTAASLTVALLSPSLHPTALAQYPPGQQGSPNMHIVTHIPMTPVSDIEIEQDLSRPYAYISRSRLAGFYIVNLRDPQKASVMYSWRVENPELHQGSASGGQYFKLGSRYYYVESFQFNQRGTDADIVAIVFDVTGLPDTTKVKEVGRIRDQQRLGGSHESYLYKHSDGRVLFFTTVTAPARYANVYDMQKVLAGDATYGLVGPVPVPDDIKPTMLLHRPTGTFIGYHDFYVGYDPATHQDKFYGAGFAGYFVYDVTRPEQPKLLVTVSGVPGVELAHTFTPTPDGRYAVGETETQYQPLRIFDLKPALDGTVKTISRPIGAWTANWQNLPHQMEVRWPYVFVAAYVDGLHVFNMMDPTKPYTVGYYDTYERLKNDTTNSGNVGSTNTVMAGVFGVDVRNADGLIVVSDNGFWAFKMDGFDGWNGHQWGMPNISSVQDWDNGPDGAPKPQRVSRFSASAAF